MKVANLQLVLPANLHETYRKSQRSWIMTLTLFVEVVSTRPHQSQDL